jgi:hypothetical protein
MSTPEQALAQIQQQLLQYQQHMTQQQNQIEQLTAYVRAAEAKQPENTNTHTSTLHPKLIPTKPDTYTGQRSTPADVWLAALERFFKAAAGGAILDDEWKIDFATAQFRDTASTWWEGYIQRQQQQTTGIGVVVTTKLTWERFKFDFLQHFLPVATKEAARLYLHKITQRSNVSGYCEDFNKHLIQIGTNGMTEADQLILFKKGINSQIAQILTIQNPKTLHEAQLLAVKLEMENPHLRTHRKNFNNNYNQHNRQQQHNPTPSHTASTPMELGRIQDRSEKEEGSDDENVHQNVNAMGRRLTPEQVEEYKKQGKCFTCGKFGHLSRNCSSRIKPQAQQQQHTKKG